MSRTALIISEAPIEQPTNYLACQPHCSALLRCSCVLTSLRSPHIHVFHLGEQFEELRKSDLPEEKRFF